MKVIGKDRTSCDVCNPIDEIIARLDALERRASAIVAKVQGIAPDGDGNVTLPTSSSDTDPLHGRVDTFAMSSEVKEAADDAHAYAASIADDVIVINSEIAALNQAVATLESTAAALNNSVAGKVSKSGDTMTGELLANGGVRSDFVRKLDSSNNNVGFVMFEETETSNIASLNARKSTGTDIAIYPALKLFANSDGTYYATLNSNYVGTNDNSDKVMTIKMANSLPSLVHTTGNETIAGAKTFTSYIYQAMKHSDAEFNQSNNTPWVKVYEYPTARRQVRGHIVSTLSLGFFLVDNKSNTAPIVKLGGWGFEPDTIAFTYNEGDNKVAIWFKTPNYESEKVFIDEIGSYGGTSDYSYLTKMSPLVYKPLPEGDYITYSSAWAVIQ